MNEPRVIAHGEYADEHGTFWLWPVDGYYDIHHTLRGMDPDGSDVISEFHLTVADARKWVREIVATNQFIKSWTESAR